MNKSKDDKKVFLRALDVSNHLRRQKNIDSKMNGLICNDFDEGPHSLLSSSIPYDDGL